MGCLGGRYQLEGVVVGSSKLASVVVVVASVVVVFIASLVVASSVVVVVAAAVVVVVSVLVGKSSGSSGVISWHSPCSLNAKHSQRKQKNRSLKWRVEFISLPFAN